MVKTVGGGVKEATTSLKPMLISNTPALIWTYNAKTGWDQLPKWGIIAHMGNNIQNGT